MNYDVKVGFARVNISPMIGIDIGGYYKKRICEGILDELEVNAIAVNKDNTTVVMMAMDALSISTNFANNAKEEISKVTGVPTEAILIHATHSHTTPRATSDEVWSDYETKYNAILKDKLVTVAAMAIADLKPARMGYAVSEAKNVAFNRRYLMKDGSAKTNPGVNNPDIVKSIGLLDERVNLVRFNREDGSNIVIVNFGNHPDTIGGNKVSGDWPGFTRRIFEKAIDNTKCVVFNGAQGDINHVNVKPKGGDLNDMINDFDDVTRGYGHARHIGNVMAASVMAVYDKVYYVDVDKVKYLQEYINIPTNMPKPEEMEEARYIKKMHDEGRDAELPYKGMWLTTMVAGATRKIELENGPEFKLLLLSAISIGNIAMIGIPGEPFTGTGIGLKESKDFDMIMPCCLTNGSMGYFPMKDSYEEGGYEAQTSRFKAGVAELIIEEGKKILSKLK